MIVGFGIGFVACRALAKAYEETDWGLAIFWRCLALLHGVFFLLALLKWLRIP